MALSVAYARYSSENQDKNTIQAQFRACHDAATRQGDKIVEEYKDEARTGTNADREDFQRMLKDLREKKHGDVKRVYIFAYSRFMRDRNEAGQLKRMLRRRARVQVISATEPLPEDQKTADLMEGIIDGVNEYLSKVTGEQSLAGSKEIARRGYWTGGPPPYGYRLVKVKDREGATRDGEPVVRTVLEKNPEEAHIVRRAFELAAATGWGGHRIYRALCEELGHPVLGRKGKPIFGEGVRWSSNSRRSVPTNLST
jgi:DNA invertase Pin-like site-specific DNA recombinase